MSRSLWEGSTRRVNPSRSHRTLQSEPRKAALSSRLSLVNDEAIRVDLSRTRVEPSSRSLSPLRGEIDSNYWAMLFPLPVIEADAETQSGGAGSDQRLTTPELAHQGSRPNGARSRPGRARK